MNAFIHHFALCAPLFSMVLLGWIMVKIRLFDTAVTKALSQFVFKFLMPVLLFDMMSRTHDMPPVDLRVLAAFFGACAIVYVSGCILRKISAELGYNRLYASRISGLRAS